MYIDNSLLKEHNEAPQDVGGDIQGIQDTLNILVLQGHVIMELCDDFSLLTQEGADPSEPDKYIEDKARENDTGDEQ